MSKAALAKNKSKNSPVIEEALLPPSHKKILRLPFKATLLTLIILSIITIPIAGVFGSVYYPSQFSFIPFEYRVQIEKMMLQTVLPKTNRQVTLAMIAKLKKMEKISHKIFIELRTDQNTAAIRLDGSSDLSTAQTSQKLSFLSDSDVNIAIQGEIYTNGNNAYFKASYLPDTIVDYLNIDLSQQWFSFDLKHLGIAPQSFIDQTINNTLPEAFINDQILSAVEVIGTEDIGGQNTYHLQLTQSAKEFKSLVSNVNSISDQASQVINKYASEQIATITIDCWVEQTSYEIVRSVISTNGKLTKIPGHLDVLNYSFGLDNLSNQEFSLTAGIEFFAVNQDKYFKSPEAIDISQLIILLNNAYNLKEQKEAVGIALVQISDYLDDYLAENGAYPSLLSDLVEEGVASELPQMDGFFFKLITAGNGDDSVFAVPDDTYENSIQPVWQYHLATGEITQMPLANYDQLFGESP